MFVSRNDAHTYSRKPGAWICPICKHPSNPGNVPACEICGCKAPRTKMGKKINGRFVLLSVHAANPPERHEMLRIFDLTWDTWHTEVGLDKGPEHLEMRVRKTVWAALGNINHRPWSRSTTPLGGSWEEDIHTHRDESFLSGNDSHDGNKTAPVLSKVSLFDQILNEAVQQVYDPHIGQYLDKSAAERSRGGFDHTHSVYAEEEDLDQTLHGLEVDFNYVKQMQRERFVMKETVQVYNQVKTAAEAAEEEFARSRKRDMSNSAVLPRNMNRPCSLCLRSYNPRNLVGSVPFNAVAEWRMQRNEPFPGDDPRLKLHRRYEACRLCAFCMQFFDEEFAEYVEYHKGTTQVADPVLVLEGKNHQGSELDVAVTKALLDKSTKRLHLLDARPGSPVLQNLAFLHLKTMREKPLLMEQVGCQLAKWSNTSNRLKGIPVKQRSQKSNSGHVAHSGKLSSSICSRSVSEKTELPRLPSSMMSKSLSIATLNKQKEEKRTGRVPIWKRTVKRPEDSGNDTSIARTTEPLPKLYSPSTKNLPVPTPTFRPPCEPDAASGNCDVPSKKRVPKRRLAQRKGDRRENSRAISRAKHVYI